jgi:hypothetical protein
MKEHDVVSFTMPIKEHGILYGHTGTIVSVYPNIYKEPQNFEVEVKGLKDTVTVHRSWITPVKEKTKKPETSVFLYSCDTYYHRGGDLIVLCRNFGGFDWPKELNYDSHKWEFVSQDAMMSDEKIYGGKAIYKQRE